MGMRGAEMNQTLNKEKKRDTTFVSKQGTSSHNVHKPFLPLNYVYVSDIYVLRQHLTKLFTNMCNSENV